MGPQRQNWTFPMSGLDIIGRMNVVETSLAARIAEKLDDEQLAEQELAEFREKMRIAGVLGWDRMQLPETSARYRGTSARDHYHKLGKQLVEMRRYRHALERDVARDPHRTFKLTFDDLDFIGL